MEMRQVKIADALALRAMFERIDGRSRESAARMIETEGLVTD
jgi:hypothetical protein